MRYDKIKYPEIWRKTSDFIGVYVTIKLQSAGKTELIQNNRLTQNKGLQNGLPDPGAGYLRSPPVPEKFLRGRRRCRIKDRPRPACRSPIPQRGIVPVCCTERPLTCHRERLSEVPVFKLAESPEGFAQQPSQVSPFTVIDLTGNLKKGLLLSPFVIPCCLLSGRRLFLSHSAAALFCRSIPLLLFPQLSRLLFPLRAAFLCLPLFWLLSRPRSRPRCHGRSRNPQAPPRA